MNRKMPHQIVGDIEALIEEIAQAGLDAPHPEPLQKGIDRLIAVGKLKAAQEIIKNVDLTAIQQGL